MDERELKILNHAINYTEQLSEGINPLDGSFIADEDIIREERIRKYLLYVESILKAYRKDKIRKTKPFAITADQLSRYTYPKDPLRISELAERISALTDDGVKNLPAHRITDWLLRQGYLYEEGSGSTKRRMPTEKGKQAGITAAMQMSPNGNYYTYLYYDTNMQRIILSNLMAIAKEGSHETGNNQQNQKVY